MARFLHFFCGILTECAGKVFSICLPRLSSDWACPTTRTLVVVRRGGVFKDHPATLSPPRVQHLANTPTMVSPHRCAAAAAPVAEGPPLDGCLPAPDGPTTDTPRPLTPGPRCVPRISCLGSAFALMLPSGTFWIGGLEIPALLLGAYFTTHPWQDFREDFWKIFVREFWEDFWQESKRWSPLQIFMTSEKWKVCIFHG